MITFGQILREFQHHQDSWRKWQIDYCYFMARNPQFIAVRIYLN